MDREMSRASTSAMYSCTLDREFSRQTTNVHSNGSTLFYDVPSTLLSIDGDGSLQLMEPTWNDRSTNDVFVGETEKFLTSMKAAKKSKTSLKIEKTNSSEAVPFEGREDSSSIFHNENSRTRTRRLSKWSMPNSPRMDSAIFGRRVSIVSLDQFFRQKKLQFLKVCKPGPNRPRNFAQVIVSQRLEVHSGAVTAIALNANGTLLATAGQDHKISMWKVHDAEEIMSQIENLSTNPEMARRDPRTLFSELTVIADVVQAELHGHSADVLDLSWSKNNFLLSGSRDQSVRLWHPNYSHCLRQFNHPGLVSVVRFSPANENFFICGGSDKQIYVWQILSSGVPELKQSIEVDDFISSMCFSPDGAILAVGTTTGTCFTFDVQGKNTSNCVPRGRFKVSQRRRRLTSTVQGCRITSMEFMNAEMNHIIISSSDSYIRIFSLSKGLIRVYRGHKNTTQFKASRSADGKYLLSASDPQHMALWDMHEMTIKRSFRHKTEVNATVEILRLNNEQNITHTVFLPRKIPPWYRGASYAKEISIDKLLNSPHDSNWLGTGMNADSVKEKKYPAAGLITISSTVGGEILVCYNATCEPSDLPSLVASTTQQ